MVSISEYERVLMALYNAQLRIIEEHSGNINRDVRILRDELQSRARMHGAGPLRFPYRPVTDDEGEWYE